MTGLRAGVKTFLAEVQKLRPKDLADSSIVLARLSTWTALQRDLHALERQGKKIILSVCRVDDPRIVWSIRLFETTGVFVTLLGWRHALLTQPVAGDLRRRLNLIRTDPPLAHGSELRVKVSDLVGTRHMDDFLAIADDLLTHL